MNAEIFKPLRSFALDVSVSVQNNEILGIMGHSGAGKSMLLKCIAGLEKPEKGHIVCAGKIWQDDAVFVPPAKRLLGFCFQNYALFETVTVEKNIAWGLSGKYRPKLSRKEQKERVREMVDLFGLHGLENVYPQNLSGGQKQRVALARMLAAKPDLCLLDEPFSAIDTDLKEELYASLRPILQQIGKPVILVSHDRREIECLCSRWVQMEEGKIVKEKIV